MSHLVLTGASGGLGRALALVYARPGARLSLTGRDPERLADTVAACRERGAAVWATPLDVRDTGALLAFLAEAEAACPVDTAMACAGVSSSVAPDGAAEPIATVRRVFAVNTLAVVETLAALAEPMRRRGRGRLAVISSLAGLNGMPSSPSYSASKAAARVYGDALRAWLTPFGVTVTVVSPGFMDTPMCRRYQGAKPLLWNADKAAAVIAAAVAAGKPRLEFPWPLAQGSRLLGLLPPRIGDAVLRRFFSFTVEAETNHIAGPSETR